MSTLFWIWRLNHYLRIGLIQSIEIVTNKELWSLIFPTKMFNITVKNRVSTVPMDIVSSEWPIDSSRRYPFRVNTITWRPQFLYFHVLNIFPKTLEITTKVTTLYNLLKYILPAKRRRLLPRCGHVASYIVFRSALRTLRP